MLRLGNVSATMLVLLLAPAEKQAQMSAHYGACVATWWHARVLSVIIATSSKTFTVKKKNFTSCDRFTTAARQLYEYL